MHNKRPNRIVYLKEQYKCFRANLTFELFRDWLGVSTPIQVRPRTTWPICNFFGGRSCFNIQHHVYFVVRLRENANMEYLKNVFYRYLTTVDTTAKQRMLVAMVTILQFSPEECRKSGVKR